jgi:hypothetical protein
MNSGRLRVAANTLLFSNSILAFATDQLSKYTAVTTSARRAARNSPRFSLGAAIALLLLPGEFNALRPPEAAGSKSYFVSDRAHYEGLSRKGQHPSV